ncbi:MAG: hypothetical protein HC936_05460 [Leptolyngbyaceae cyanobacterium SU_3_3]|nr:hypothetical protein [Leptolyngbyaceae cyanobacterium SU_3_3]
MQPRKEPREEAPFSTRQSIKHPIGRKQKVSIFSEKGTSPSFTNKIFSQVPLLKAAQPASKGLKQTNANALFNKAGSAYPTVTALATYAENELTLHRPVIQRAATGGRGRGRGGGGTGTATQVTEKVIASHTGVTLQQLPLSGPEKVAQCTGYMNNTYTAAGGSVSFGGKSRAVYDITGSRWGYIDTSHGEIEAFPAEQTSGTTTHIIPLRFDYDEVEKTLRAIKTTIYRVTNVTTLAAVAVSGKKAHTYTMI